ncbi:methyl-accepting chemotaxis protein [Lysobacter sp. HA35]
MSTSPQPRSFLTHLRLRRRDAHLEGRMAAIERSQAVIEFDLDGHVLDANANFLDTFGVRLEDVRGKHHRMFVDPAIAAGDEYRAFWQSLARGEFVSGQFRRVRPGGGEVWLQATYNPLFDDAGRVVRVVKFASDITAQKQRDIDTGGQIAAIERSMAVIEFEVDGRILRANDNFLALLGYAAAEVTGQHHSMFVDAVERTSAEYRAFWASLARGDVRSGQFRRRTRDGREVWIEASYNPILDADGRVIKVVKFATDITAQRNRNADFESQLQAIHKVQAVIVFDLGGVVLDANDNFLHTMGYAREDIVGRHHSMFVPAADREGKAYREFWARLGRGEADSGRYERRTRDGRAVWLQASYNPILDGAGRAYKIVKYATDVTEQVQFANDLQILVKRVEAFSQSITAGAGEIALGNDDLARRTEQQAAALEETAAALGRIAASVDETASNAQSADTLAVGMSSAARDGHAAVDRMTATMQRIRESSSRVMDVLAVIDGIAFQTNILALNAAVEAARAGDRGRGFAVVASEVRALAQRCVASAKDIKRMLGESGEAVAEGGVRVTEADRAMRAILDAVTRSTQLIASISEATRAQDHGMREINAALRGLEETTQQNAALVEEVSAASASLDNVAAELQGAMVGFAAGRVAMST